MIYFNMWLHILLHIILGVSFIVCGVAVDFQNGSEIKFNNSALSWTGFHEFYLLSQMEVFDITS